jgi:hypothetical protein
MAVPSAEFPISELSIAFYICTYIYNNNDNDNCYKNSNCGYGLVDLTYNFISINICVCIALFISYRLKEGMEYTYYRLYHVSIDKINNGL